MRPAPRSSCPTPRARRAGSGWGQEHYMVVRFGNVLGSRLHPAPVQGPGRRGGPVTVTDPAASRYFMTIPGLLPLLKTSGVGLGGESYLLDMGEPILMRELASRSYASPASDPTMTSPSSTSGQARRAPRAAVLARREPRRYGIPQDQPPGAAWAPLRPRGCHARARADMLQERR